MRRLASLVLVSACVSACGGAAARFTTEYAGNGIAAVTPRGGVAMPAQSVAIGQGAYDLHLHFDVPRAQLVEWTVACPGAEQRGSLGEPFEAYRTRRLAQLQAQREQDRRNASAVTSALVGAFVPNATATAQAGPVRVDAQGSPGAAAGAAVAGSMDMNVQLPPGDVGAGPIETVVHLVTTTPGACAVTAIADDPVLGRFEILHLRDLWEEAADREVAIVTSAEHARAAMNAQLVAFGADVNARAKQQAAAAALHAEREAKIDVAAEREAAKVSIQVGAEADAELALHARAEAETRTRVAHRLQIVMEARARWRLLLISWGADAEYRARLRGRAAELEARRYRIAMQARVRWRLLLISWGADVEWRMHQQLLHEREQLADRARLDAELDARGRAAALALEASIRARTSVRSYLVMLGARARPPMPAMRIEDRGPVPFDGASWIAGHWTWSSAAWAWNAGGWTDQSVAFGAAGGEAAVEHAPVYVAPLAETSATIITEPVRVPGTITITNVVEPVRDHRTTTVRVPLRSEPVRDVRDHRPAKPAPAPLDPKVRDHRH